MIIAVDFDGTVVEHRYPAIGKIRPFAFETLLLLQKKGHTLILWTYRKGTELEAAVDFCSDHGIQFYAVNSNDPYEVWKEDDHRKIYADIYIDDRNLGGIPSWGEIYQMICPEEKLPYMKKESWRSSLQKRIFR